MPLMVSAATTPCVNATWASSMRPVTSPTAYTFGTFVRIWPSTGTKPRSSGVTPAASRPRPSVFGCTPMPSSTRSHSNSPGSPPASYCTTVLPSRSSVPSTRALVTYLMPCFRKARSSSADTSSSSIGTRCSSISKMVTSAP